METNYELKHKCLLVPLRAALLVIVMVLVGFTTYAQQGKSVKVADNQQLKEAMENPLIGSITLEAGYYPYLNYYAESGTKVRKGDGNGSRADCQYYIFDDNVCIATAEIVADPAFDPPTDPDPIPPGAYYEGTAIAGTNDPSACLCCPPVPNMGSWTWVKADSYYTAPDTLYFGKTLDKQDMTFFVTGPGVYSLKYSWPAPYNSFVQTEYVFRGVYDVEVSSEDVCGNTTEVDFILDGLDIFTYDVTWQLTNLTTNTVYIIAGPDSTDTFTLDVDPYGGCGSYELIAMVNTNYGNPAEEEDCYSNDTVLINFSCEPIADAGPDVNVCNDICAILTGSTGIVTLGPTYAWSWVQLSGPTTLSITPNGGMNELEVEVCADELADCPYGEYEVQFQVLNGECYDDDNAIVRFYEQPIADAGDDQYLCNTFSFSLNAVPYVYCGVEGVNYWSEHHWELVSQADALAVVTIVDPTDPNSGVMINTDAAVCAFGPYEFMWVENNSKGDTLGGCTDADNVIVTIFEEPVIDAGDDMVFCNTFAFSLWGVGDEPCYDNTVVVYNWEKGEQPGECIITFTPNNIPNPMVEITGCDPDSCSYGEYIFTFTQSNGYLNDAGGFVPVCETSEDVSVWIFEEPVANAGLDLALCNDFAFTLGAIPTEFCGEEDENYMTWGVWSVESAPLGSCITFDDPNDPETEVEIDESCVPCPFGTYIFKWTEYNGFDEVPFQGCWDEDFVSVTIYETPDVDAGPDMSFCEVFDFTLDGTIDAPCNDGLAYSISWEVVSQPDACDIAITPGTIDPAVSITNCDPCQYGEYVFRVTQSNGYFEDDGTWVSICEGSDEVSVWIFEQPEVSAGPDLLLCNEYEFELNAVGSLYCGDFGVNYNNWYSWVLVSGPVSADCDVIISDPTELSTEVSIENCVGDCFYGEWIFGFTEYNGNADAYCTAYDEVSVFIFEQPEADAGDDIDACIDITDTSWCYNMTASLEYCYTMYGVWTKSCGPGDVVFTDVNDPLSEVCFDEPGHYVFEWTVLTGAVDCEDVDTVVFNVLEQPTAMGEFSELEAPCDSLCIDLGLAEITKYDYFGTDAGECPNFNDLSNWTLVEGPDGTDPLQVVFADDTDPATEMCVSWYGAYTVRWSEVNKAVDSDFQCDAFFDVFVTFYETPEPFAGDDDAICGNCYTLEGVQYTYLPLPNQHLNDYYYWESLPTNPCPVTFSDFESLTPMVCIPDDFACYGTYGFVLHESNGDCIGSDTVYICFSDVPDDIAICFDNNPNDCGPGYGYPDNNIEFTYYGCLLPDEVLEVCAEGCTYIQVNPYCNCLPGFDWSNPAYFGYTFEWSLISPAGTTYDSQPGYYDFENGWWVYPWIDICWGECCDTARLYLTITGPEGACGLTCENTMEYKFYVYHKPCANIVGPDVSEVGLVTTYCNVCPPEFDTDCLLYTWTAEHCGEIISGQGTECIEVLWTDYNINGGWGEITLTVFDTCTGCCNYDEMLVKIWPTGTVGDAMLSGHVYYHNNGETPLNGVEIQLWNGGIPVMSTESFNDIEGGNGVGYYEFPGINGVTEFGITASHDAPWYGANATDALAVELKTINALPGSFVYDNVVEQAMDVNDNTNITSTDALWIKQRAINMVSYFPAGDWVFDPMMTANASDTPYDIYTLNAGDANRSNVPNSNKSMPDINLVKDGTINVVAGQVFELPIRIAKAEQFGAISLNLEYNSALIEVVEVASQDGMLDNIGNGIVRIAWSNVNPMVLEENDVVVTLKVKALGEIASTESLFSIGMGSEFADQSAFVIEPVTLKSFGVTTGPAAADYFLSTNRPNPFSTYTTIEYTMPETGKVKLSVLDMLGQEIAVLVEATQTAGSYTVEFHAAGLATGVYIYKISVDGESRDFISTQRMVVSH